MIVTAAITSLLLPLGVWLVLSSATSPRDENRVASSGLLALLIATAAFALFGFAFMFGNAGHWLPDPSNLHSSLNLPLPTPQPWNFVGLSGFFFQDVPFSGLTLFLPYLALAQTCAILVNSVIAHRSHALTQIAVATVSGGVAFGIAGHWIFGGGWLAMLGQNLGFGHGTLDVGGMATVGLIAGAFTAAFLMAGRPENQSHDSTLLPASPETASSSFPFRTLSGALLILIGAVAVVASNPMLGPQTERTALGFAVNLVAASSAAGLFALVYTLFTSAEHKANIACAAHAMLAALIAISSAGGLLPVWSAALLGIVAGGLATVGVFWVQTRLSQSDHPLPLDSAASMLLTSVFAPAILSFVATGLLANGALGAGWNGVGATTYLGIAQLGISGLLPVREGVSDAGQLTAQVCGLVAVTLFASAVAVGLIRLLRLSFTANLLTEGAITTLPDNAPQEAAVVNGTPLRAGAVQTRNVVTPFYTAALDPSHSPVSTATYQVETLIVQTSSGPTLSISSQEENAALPETDGPKIELPSPIETMDAVPASPPSRPPRAKPFVVDVTEETPVAEEGLVERMRKLRRSRLPAQPVRARKIAYPIRVAGRRLIRPMVEDNTPKP